MEITVSGRHMGITDPIKSYAYDKVSKLPRYYDRIAAIEVIADTASDHGYEVEIIVKAEHHDPFVAKATSSDLYACIDEAVNKLERQLTDHKQKLRNRKHKV